MNRSYVLTLLLVAACMFAVPHADLAGSTSTVPHECLVCETVTSDALIFKGGTCLAKVHAQFYRLSEDLDFVISTPIEANRAERSERVAPIEQAVASFWNRLLKNVRAIPA